MTTPVPSWMAQATSSPMLKAALDYAEHGWPVLPLFAPRDGECECPKRQTCTSAGKHPRNDGGLTNASTDPTVIRGWWSMWPTANVAIVTGARSGTVALDVDPRHNGFESLATFDPLPQTVQAKTGSGGAHFLFAHPGRPVRNSSQDIANGLDVRGDGGYIVVAPSLHASGNRYVWTSEPFGPLAPMPAMIEATEKRPRALRPALEGAIGEGGRNQHLASLAGSMRQRGMSHAAIDVALRVENRDRCNPPLEDAEVEAIAASVSRYQPDPAPTLMTANSKTEGAVTTVSKRGTAYAIQSAADLMGKDIPPARFAVPGLLTEGLNVLAAPPKMGKSWISLGFAIAVSAGLPALGNTECEQGDVLYLALEDSPRRLQSRLRLLGADQADLRRLTLVTEPGLDDDPFPRANQGGLEWIANWLRTHESARLVIIDTLAMFRTARVKNGDIYQEDYDAANAIKQLAGAYGVAVLVVHHTSKAKSDDFVTSVSGTNGITGAADGVLIMARTRLTQGATLSVTGRDIEEKAYGLTEQGVGNWIIVGDAAEVQMSAIRRDILDVMRLKGQPMGATDVAKELGITANTARQRMWTMRQAGVLSQNFGGKYHLPDFSDPKHTSITHNITNGVTGYALSIGSKEVPGQLRLPTSLPYDPLVPYSNGARP